MAQQTCENCRFFDQFPSADERTYDGHCLRYPPQFSTHDYTPWLFPEVRQSNYCGEWRPILENGNIAAYGVAKE